ncbi:Hypothetical protein UVM_LOCUS506 [uncultured virus]|nr:Hypothetical protein UVM_LOCUS506 [uncultured virus]
MPRASSQLRDSDPDGGAAAKSSASVKSASAAVAAPIRLTRARAAAAIQRRFRRLLSRRYRALVDNDRDTDPFTQDPVYMIPRSLLCVDARSQPNFRIGYNAAQMLRWMVKSRVHPLTRRPFDEAQRAHCRRVVERHLRRDPVLVHDRSERVAEMRRTLSLCLAKQRLAETLAEQAPIIVQLELGDLALEILQDSLEMRYISHMHEEDQSDEDDEDDGYDSECSSSSDHSETLQSASRSPSSSEAEA